MGKLKKRSSKRKTLSQKYKVERKVKEHKRKIKKEAKKQRAFGLVKKRLRKQEDYIPNLFPYKEQVINAIERRKQREDELKKAAFLRNKLAGELGRAGDIAGYATEVKNAVVEYEEKHRTHHESEEQKELQPFDSKQLSKKAHLRELESVLNNSEVVVEVLDARDPLGCRSEEVETRVLNAGKKLVLLLNKIDLVPPKNVKEWFHYLSQEHDTVIFKANTQSVRPNERLPRSAALDLSKDEQKTLSYLKRYSSSSLSLGGDNLLQLLKSALAPGQSVTVGVVGFPNVGKSSLINSLKQEAVAGVSSTPGFTTSMKEIILDQRIKLLDSPGVVFGKYDPHSLILRNVIRAEDLNDPITAVEAIVKKVPVNNLLVALEIAEFQGVRELLERVAAKRGFLKQKGIYDLERAGKAVLQAWNQGKISYFTQVPRGGMEVEH